MDFLVVNSIFLRIGLDCWEILEKTSWDPDFFDRISSPQLEKTVDILETIVNTFETQNKSQNGLI
jgi:hypothetical protein